jgi:hypothetical protein
MTTYFTYYLYHIPTGKKYYGARWKPGCHPSDLWNTYFTSSKHVHKLIEEYGKESFEYKIRKTFVNKSECISWEQKVLKRLKVKTNNNWLNIAIGNPSMLGKRHSEETKAKMRKPKGPWSEERKLAKSLDEKNKIANGKPMPTTKGLILPMKKISCPHCNKIGGVNNMKRYHLDNCKLRSHT